VPYFLHLQRKVEGYRDGKEGDKFVDAIGRNISLTLGNKDFDLPSFVERIIEAAESNAYTRLDFGGSGGPSPVFVSSMILISLSYTVSLFDHEKAWSPSQRQKVIEWGNRIDRNQEAKKQYSTLDSIAAIAAARMSWGAATWQPEIFQRGLSDFHVVARHMDKNGQYESNMMDNNETIQFMILAAETATRNGISAYDFSYGGKTLHDAVKWHVDKTRVEGGPDTRGARAGHEGTYINRRGRSSHIAWAPIYLSRFPDRPVALDLRKLLAEVDYYKQGLFGTSMGGPTECLWGRHR
jgi:hypothetical protein